VPGWVSTTALLLFWDCTCPCFGDLSCSLEVLLQLLRFLQLLLHLLLQLILFLMLHFELGKLLQKSCVIAL
jgi:hypothetical protein